MESESSNGTLQMTNVIQSRSAQVAGILADLAGTTPSTGTARYYVGDNLGSTRGVYGADKSTLGTYEYYPYGNMYAQTGAATESLAGAFTGKPYEGSTIDLYYFPYRYYSPIHAKWLTRDPLGMQDGLNVYEYVSCQPLVFYDELGLMGNGTFPPGTWPPPKPPKPPNPGGGGGCSFND